MRRRLHRAPIAAGLGLVVLVAAACGGSGSPARSSSRTSGGGTAGAASVDLAAVGGFGSVLVTSSGRTLYLLTGAGSCTGACTGLWPPLLTHGTPTAGTGVTASLVGTTARSGGGTQVTYAGHPLYTYSGDSGKGQANGQGITSFGGTWYVVGSSGSAVTAGSPPTTSGGYGY